MQDRRVSQASNSKIARCLFLTPNYVKQIGFKPDMGDFHEILWGNSDVELC
jgi:hypothetical protein